MRKTFLAVISSAALFAGPALAGQNTNHGSHDTITNTNQNAPDISVNNTKNFAVQEGVATGTVVNTPLSADPVAIAGGHSTVNETVAPTVEQVQE